MDADEQGHWHLLGRLETGTLLLGPVAGPQHTLVARPLRDCVVRRIGLRELYQPERDTRDLASAYDEYGNAASSVPPDDEPASGVRSLRAAASRRSLSILFQAPMADRAGQPAAVADDDIFWMQVPPGSVQYGSLYGAEAAADLLMDPAVWQSMVDQQYRLLTTLDRWIEQLERTHEDPRGGRDQGR